ncbi:hypothetical protein I79_002337 [Cricetulus griseus]|uniref:Uncharacterized protein n=1 Tax=Cricetulus griseus TaxID=10029 RepID=G3GXA2_CRIGR|nr:hypothetical protein I79_002337 [Cricetulus griseus]
MHEFLGSIPSTTRRPRSQIQTELETSLGYVRPFYHKKNKLGRVWWCSSSTEANLV